MLWEALEPHRGQLAPRLWAVLEKARAGRSEPAGLRRRPGPLRPREPPLGGRSAARWPRRSSRSNPVVVGHWLEALRPVSGKLTAPLAAIFRDTGAAETEHVAGHQTSWPTTPATIPRCWPTCSWMPTRRRIRASSRSSSSRRPGDVMPVLPGRRLAKDSGDA